MYFGSPIEAKLARGKYLDGLLTCASSASEPPSQSLSAPVAM